MKKIVLSIIGLIFILSHARAQFDAQFSQYMLNKANYNPAAVGESNLIDATFQWRKQWIGVVNAGQPLSITLSAPIKIGNSTQGIGFKIQDENIGLFSNESYGVQYAYKKKYSFGTFSAGLFAGIISIGFNGDSVKNHTIPIGDYHKLSTDKSIPQTNVKGTSLDLGAGILFSTENYYVGLSYSHINNPVISWSDKYEFTVYGTAYLVGGYNYILNNPKYIIKPSCLFKTDFKSIQVDANGILEFDNKYWGGLGFRLNDAIILSGGTIMPNGITIGASYDIPTSRIAGWGSVEAVISYSFEYVFGKSTSRYKSIRFL